MKDNAYPDHGKEVVHLICSHCGRAYYHLKGKPKPCPECKRMKK